MTHSPTIEWLVSAYRYNCGIREKSDDNGERNWDKSRAKREFYILRPVGYSEIAAPYEIDSAWKQLIYATVTLHRI